MLVETAAVQICNLTSLDQEHLPTEKSSNSLFFSETVNHGGGYFSDFYHNIQGQGFHALSQYGDETGKVDVLSLIYVSTGTHFYREVIVKVVDLPCLVDKDRSLLLNVPFVRVYFRPSARRCDSGAPLRIRGGINGAHLNTGSPTKEGS
ncbi:hypothetical protein PROFUN_07768 [Planoprotostelium fungivorum]|uniref:Uncharacterized protein n=1 Tax=Planoprotostelium fungivorum TaxID=1890364 RepID=A0A2P6MX68_9EUKA|nr:hypothetical protein PROFUN_07768 [Planoprotostelium fungivorum]